MSYDEKVLQCFLDNQLRLYPEPVAETLEEAENFLEDVCAVVVKGKKKSSGILRKRASTSGTTMRNPF